MSTLWRARRAGPNLGVARADGGLPMNETTTARVADLKKKYPASLHPIFDRASEIVPYLRPDITVRINRADCMKVNFTMKYIPLLADVMTPPVAPNDKRMINVVVHDENGVYTHRHYWFTRAGDEITDTVELPLPKDIAPPKGWARTFFVIADPLNQILEREEGNNFATLKGVC
jgi:hypothetical protein